MGRHVKSGADADAAPLVEPQTVISPDTYVGARFAVDDAQDATPSPARPDAFVEHGMVGDGHELE